MRFRAPFLLSMALVTLAASAIAQTGSSGLSRTRSRLGTR
jgi:hypothetical protein